MLKIAKYSVGTGDRFAHQGKAQLCACMNAADAGVEVVPVWNKSNREHTFIGSEPSSVRAEADAAVAALGWKGSYHVDADHINLTTVDRFLAPSDFFTIDVAHSIGKPAAQSDLDAFAQRHPEIADPTPATKYLAAVQEAGRIYRHIENGKGVGNFITEVSMDETDAPQTPAELRVILAAIADEKIPVQTIAPKFTGRFNKGVDYVGDLAQFEREFEDDVLVITGAIRDYGLPETLKLSVHSGSDKFSIYGPMARILRKYGAGVHLKTAGTTWLEELIGLAEAGGDALKLVAEIYAKAFEMREALCEPYATVIDIDFVALPTPAAVAGWSSEQVVSALRHDQSNPAFDKNFRQLLHVGFKIAAKLGDRYLGALRDCEADVSRNVTLNLWERHVRPLFLP